MAVSGLPLLPNLRRPVRLTLNTLDGEYLDEFVVIHSKHPDASSFSDEERITDLNVYTASTSLIQRILRAMKQEQ